MRQIVLFPGENNMWVAECPSLQGCISQGDTKETAIENIKEAIRLYFEVLREDNLLLSNNF
jgi:predicted RNase H-like HicB family nuclease